MTIYYAIIYLAVLLASAAQILLKIGAAKSGLSIGILVLNSTVIFGLAFMVLSMLLSIRALSVIPLRDTAFILPTVYILVPFFSYIFLNEKMSRRTLFGTAIIILGVVLFNLPMG